MKNYNLLIFLFSLSLVIGFYPPVTETAQAQSDFIIYPNDGQSKEQQEQDQFSCYSWAKEQTGFDPMEAPRATAPPPQKKQEEHAEQQWAQQQVSQYEQRRNGYNRAYSACLEGRGYTVR
jgi:hypothetical protein